MPEKKVDVDAVMNMLDTVQQWSERPDIKDQIAKALVNAENLLLGLVLTGVAAGLWPGTPEANQFLSDKMRIAFEAGYYFKSVSKGD